MDNPPVALFVIAKEISVVATDKKIRQVYSNDTVPGTLYLVINRVYPVFNPEWPDDGMTLQGTVPPVVQFSNMFSGKTIEEAAEWLENGPESMFLERKLFTVLDDYSEANDTITICRRNLKKADGSFHAKDEYGEVEWFPHAAANTGDVIGAIQGVFAHFDDCLDMYQMRRQTAAGKRGAEGPDLSRGTPYWKR